AYLQLSGSARVAVIENGIASLREPRWRAPRGAQLLYAGSLTYGPNAEAVAHFIRTILPLVEQAFPDVRLLVTGATPAETPPGIEHPRVELTGWLDEGALEATYRHS